jgi:hypothetical protein
MATSVILSRHARMGTRAESRSQSDAGAMCQALQCLMTCIARKLKAVDVLSSAPRKRCSTGSRLSAWGWRTSRWPTSGRTDIRRSFNVFNVVLCDELLDGEMFNTLREARIAIGSCWRDYDVSPTLSCVLLSDDARGRRARRARVAGCPPHISIGRRRPLWYRDQL